MSGNNSACFSTSPILRHVAGLLALWGVLSAGCALLRPVLPPLPEEERLAVAAAYAEKILESESCEQFESDVRVRFGSLLKDASLSGILLAKKPQSLKFVGLSPFGQPLIVLVIDGQSFLLVDVPSQKAFNGSSRSARASEVFPFEQLEGIGLYSLLSGVPVPGNPFDPLVSSAGAEKEGQYLLSWPTADDGLQRVVFDARHSRVRAYELVGAAGSVLLRIAYAGQDGQKCGLPTSITVSGSEVRGRIELTLEGTEVTSDLTEDDFRLELPPGYRLETVP